MPDHAKKLMEQAQADVDRMQKYYRALAKSDE